MRANTTQLMKVVQMMPILSFFQQLTSAKESSRTNKLRSGNASNNISASREKNQDGLLVMLKYWIRDSGIILNKLNYSIFLLAKIMKKENAGKNGDKRNCWKKSLITRNKKVKEEERKTKQAEAEVVPSSSSVKANLSLVKLLLEIKLNFSSNF